MFVLFLEAQLVRVDAQLLSGKMCHQFGAELCGVLLQLAGTGETGLVQAVLATHGASSRPQANTTATVTIVHCV